MSVETDFRALLAAAPGVAALAGTRIALNAAPEGSALPLVVFAVQHTPVHNLLGDIVEDQCAITAECWAATATQADALADAVVAALAGAPAAAAVRLVARAPTHDPELGLDGTVLNVEWWAA